MAEKTEEIVTKQRKRGPKAKVKNGKRYTSYLPEETYEKLMVIGAENLSHGIRVVTMVYEEQYGTEMVPELLIAVK